MAHSSFQLLLFQVEGCQGLQKSTIDSIFQQSVHSSRFGHVGSLFLESGGHQWVRMAALLFGYYYGTYIVNTTRNTGTLVERMHSFYIRKFLKSQLLRSLEISQVIYSLFETHT